MSRRRIPAEALHIFFTVPFEPQEACSLRSVLDLQPSSLTSRRCAWQVITDNKVWGFFALACINWLATASLLFLLCVVSNPCPTRLLELVIFNCLYNVRGHFVMIMGFGAPEGAVTFADAAGDIIPIWTCLIVSLWQYSLIPKLKDA